LYELLIRQFLYGKHHKLYIKCIFVSITNLKEIENLGGI